MDYVIAKNSKVSRAGRRCKNSICLRLLKRRSFKTAGCGKTVETARLWFKWTALLTRFDVVNGLNTAMLLLTALVPLLT